MKVLVNIPLFPAKEIETCIRDFLADVDETQAILDGHRSFEPVIDSLEAVLILTELESKFPLVLPNSTVRPGGYMSIDDAVTDLMPKLERRWRKHHGEKADVQYTR